MAFIELKLTDGRSVSVNLDRVRSIQPNLHGGTFVSFDRDRGFYVDNDYKQVMQLIQEAISPKY